MDTGKHTCTLQHTIVLTTTFYNIVKVEFDVSTHGALCGLTLAYGYAGGAR